MCYNRTFVTYRQLTAYSVVLSAALLAGCGRSPSGRVREAKEAESALPPVAQEEVQTFNLASYTDEGAKRWEVKGRTANLIADLIELTDLTATAYGEEANVTLTAKEGTFDRQDRRVHLRQDVTAVTTEGTTLRTQSLTWDSDQQVAVSDDWTTVERDTLTVQGQGAVGAAQFKQVRFQEDVRVDLKPSTTITCRGPLIVDYERHRARFWRRVHIRDPRGEIWADRMDVLIDPKTRELSEVQCWGHVKIRQESQLARAHRARYRQWDGKITLIGHPKVTFNAEHVEREPR